MLNAAQKTNENEMTCKSIANEMEEIINGELYICPECGEKTFIDYVDEEETESKCNYCNATFDINDVEQANLYDYLTDYYNIEYRIDGNKEYKSVQLMIACGGPNIYIDTASAAVELYWWSERASWHISREVCNEIDCIFEELYNC